MKNGRRRDKRGLQNFSGAPPPLIKPPNSVPVHQKFAAVGKAKSQRDRLTLHQPIRLRPQRCIQRCISQKAAYIFFGPVPPHPTTAQHTGPNTHSNTQHTHARSRRTCRRPDDWAAHLLHTSVRHVIVIHEGGWSTQELSYTEQDPRGKNWAQRTASAAAQQTSQPAATPGDRWDPRVGSEGFHYIR